MANVTRRSFVTTVGAASVASATALLAAPMPAAAAVAPASLQNPSGPAPVDFFFSVDERSSSRLRASG